MKKIMNFVLMAVLAVCFVLPAAGKAEAANWLLSRWLTM